MFSISVIQCWSMYSGNMNTPRPPFSEKLYYTHNFISDLISCSLKVTFTNDYCCNLKLFCLFYEHEFFICENSEEKLTKKMKNFQFVGCFVEWMNIVCWFKIMEKMQTFVVGNVAVFMLTINMFVILAKWA